MEQAQSGNGDGQHAPAADLVAFLPESLSEERARIDRITSRLDVTADLIERADLGSELVRSASRYEDTLERVFAPR